MKQGQFSSEAVRIGASSNDTNLPDPVTELVNLALDPAYDTPAPVDTGVARAGVAPSGSGSAPTMDFRFQPSYADGGMVGPGGVPQRPTGVTPPQAQGGAPIPPQQMQAEVQRIVQQHPEQIAQVKQAMMQALQSGEMTPQELNMVQQLATAAAQNPQLYPQIRQFALQQGLGTEQDIPQQYDQGLVFVLLLAAQTLQGGGAGPGAAPGGGVPQASMQPPGPAYKEGGALPQKARNRDGSIPISAHEGEYVIPKHVVLAKGTDFFDKMLENYEPGNDKT